jgi:hypothetical protein
LFVDLPRKGIVKGATLNSDSDTQASEKGANASEIKGLYGYVLKGKWKPDYNRGLIW